MELRHVRYFVAVADNLSFTKGAEKLRISQPSLTRQIRSLEEELGIRLLDRSKKHVRLTNEGEHFLVGARRLINYSVELVESLRALEVKKSAQINIGYLPNPFHRALPVSLALFEKRFPNVSINLFGMPSVEQVRSLIDGKIDLAFMGLLDPVDERGLQSRMIAAYRGVMLLPKNHRAARKKLIHLKDAAQMFFISLSDTCYHGYGQWLNITCQKVGFKPRILQVADNESMLIQAIRSELGIALLPDQIRKIAPESVAIRDVFPTIRIESFAAWRKDNSSGELKNFLEIIKQVSKKML